MKYKAITEITIKSDKLEAFKDIWASYVEELVELYDVEHAELRVSPTMTSYYCVIEFDSKQVWKKFWVERESSMKSYTKFVCSLMGNERRYAGPSHEVNNMKPAEGMLQHHAQKSVDTDAKPLDEVDFSNISIGQVNVSF